MDPNYINLISNDSILEEVKLDIKKETISKDDYFTEVGLLESQNLTTLEPLVADSDFLVSEQNQILIKAEEEEVQELIETPYVFSTENLIYNEYNDQADQDESLAAVETTSQNSSNEETASEALERCFSCDICFRTFKERGHLRRHVRTHAGSRPFKCNQCNKSFIENYTLKRHMETHKKEGQYRCDECGRSLTRKHSLKLHLKIHEAEKAEMEAALANNIQTVDASNSNGEELTSNVVEDPFKCKKCEKCFLNMHDFGAHLQTHAEESSLVEPNFKINERPTDELEHVAEASRSQDSTAKPSGQQKPFKCYRCGVCFDYRYLLKAHKETHTGRTVFKCEHCGVAFSRLTSYKFHMENGCEESRPYQCEQCGLSFIHKSSWYKHSKKHREAKAFKCDQCGMGFINDSSLKEHLRKHRENLIEEKSFKCMQCGACFSRQSSFKLHLENGCGNSKPFQCKLCSLSFLHRCSLNKHLKKHKGEEPFQCEDCDKGFFAENRLQEHSRTHIDESLFKCDHCGKDFTFSLRSHLSFLTGDKPFKCEHCYEAFRLLKSLKSHLRNHLPPFKCETCCQIPAEDVNLNVNNTDVGLLDADSSSNYVLIFYPSQINVVPPEVHTAADSIMETSQRETILETYDGPVAPNTALHVTQMDECNDTSSDPNLQNDCMSDVSSAIFTEMTQASIEIEHQIS